MVTLMLIIAAVLALAIIGDNNLGRSGVMILFGLIIGIFLGAYAALSIGDKVPIKSTILAHQELQVLNIGDDGGNLFYLEQNQKDGTYIYQAGNLIDTASEEKVVVVYDAPTKPYVETIDNAKDYSNGQTWRWWFGIKFEPVDKFHFHLAQGSVYVIP